MSNLSSLVNSLVSFAKKVAGKVSKDKDADVKYFKSRIAEIDKTLKDIDDELEYHKNHKINAKTVAKIYASSLISYTGQAAAELAELLIASKILGKVLKVTGLNEFSRQMVKILLIPINAIAALTEGTLDIKDYNRSLGIWKSELEEKKKNFQYKLERAENIRDHK